jgi:acyl-CoA hydrolase
MELVTTKICMALDIGVHGNMFGGNMMAFLDEVAGAYACQKRKPLIRVVFLLLYFSIV